MIKRLQDLKKISHEFKLCVQYAIVYFCTDVADTPNIKYEVRNRKAAYLVTFSKASVLVFPSIGYVHYFAAVLLFDE
jgi:hypothetical protein